MLTKRRYYKKIMKIADGLTPEGQYELLRVWKWIRWQPKRYRKELIYALFHPNPDHWEEVVSKVRKTSINKRFKLP